MDSNDFSATLHGESDRVQTWREVFGTNSVPITSPVPHQAHAPGVTAGWFYMIDLRCVMSEQRRRMVRYIAQKFAVPEAEVDATLDEVGCPILADDVTVTIFNPQRWL